MTHVLVRFWVLHADSPNLSSSPIATATDGTVRGSRQTNLLCVALPVRGAASAQSDRTDNLPFPSLPSRIPSGLRWVHSVQVD
jgi:hypothetical protein